MKDRITKPLLATLAALLFWASPEARFIAALFFGLIARVLLP